MWDAGPKVKEVIIDMPRKKALDGGGWTMTLAAASLFLR